MNTTNDFDIQVFRHVPDLDVFVCTDLYLKAAYGLRIAEWNPVVWIGRLFCMDEDYGEHWMDNEELFERCPPEMIQSRFGGRHPFLIRPSRMAAGTDGPCHSEDVRRRFWTDVLKSLRVSWSTLVAEARENNENCRKSGVLPEDADDDEGYVPDLEARIERVRVEILASAGAGM